MLREKGYEFDAITLYPQNEVLKSLGNRFHAHIDHGEYESAMDSFVRSKRWVHVADIRKTG